MRDEIIEEVERVREEIARRNDFNIDRIFEAAKERSIERRATDDHQPAESEVRHSA